MTEMPPTWPEHGENLDRASAAAEIVARAGAGHVRIGFDGPDSHHPSDFWAEADVAGRTLSSRHHRNAADAVEGLAFRLMTGAKCRPCGRLIQFDGSGAAFAHFRTNMADGTTWTAAEAVDAGQCVWHREADHWIRGCETTHPNPPAPTTPTDRTL